MATQVVIDTPEQEPLVAGGTIIGTMIGQGGSSSGGGTTTGGASGGGTTAGGASGGGTTAGGTSREIPAGGLPADAGCVISNVGTLCAISECFRLGKPLIDRGFTVSGGACETPKNLKVPIGTIVSDLAG